VIVYATANREQENAMIQAFLYVRDAASSAKKVVERLIMHRCFQDDEDLNVNEVMRSLEFYIKEEQLNIKDEILIRVREDHKVKTEELDLKNFAVYTPDVFPEGY
jgi:hypothetical protein